MAKNTAPAIAAACCVALEQDKDAVVIVLPSDHVIKDKYTFKEAVDRAVKQSENGFLVTFGIVPTFSATGYGYVKGGSHVEHHVYLLGKFVEKPNLETAQKYLASGEYSRNSGMFVFKAQTFLDELAKYEPEMAKLSCESYSNAKKQ